MNGLLAPTEPLREKKETPIVNYMATGAIPYCCPGQGSVTCTPLPTTNEIKKSPGSVAFAVLLMLGDGYLPGVVLVALQLRSLAPKVPRVCMVTSDVSATARSVLEGLYTEVIEVPYISIPENSYTNKTVARVYSRTFTKLNVLRLTQYSRVVVLDADIVPLRYMDQLAAVKAPAGVFFGCTRPWLSEESRQRYKKLACKIGHGKIVPEEVYRRLIDRECQPGFKFHVETSVFVVPTGIAHFEKAMEILNTARKPAITLKGDSSLFGHLFTKKWRMLDIRYVARWVATSTEEDAFIIDNYGNKGKPWETDKMHMLHKYNDVVLWWKAYVDRMRYRAKLRQAHPKLEEVYVAAKAALSLKQDT